MLDAGWTAQDDLEAAIWQAMRRYAVTTRYPVKFADAILRAAAATHQPRRTIIREATALDDPYLRYAGLPFSAPRGWLEDHEGDL